MAGTLFSPTNTIYNKIALVNATKRTIDVSGDADGTDDRAFGQWITVAGLGIDGNLNAGDQTILENAFVAYPGETIVIDRPVKITSNLTIPSTIYLHFTRNGKLAFVGDIVLTFSDGCQFNDVMHTIFDFDSPIKIKGTINHSYWRPEWFGANPDDTNADFGRIINEMFDYTIDPSTSTGFFPGAFRFRNFRKYYTTEPVKYRAITAEITQSDGINYEHATSVNIVDASAFPNSGAIYMWTDIDRWARIEYTGKTGNTLTGCVWSVYHGLSDDYGDVSDGASVRRGTSRMNDFVLESEARGSRYGGAILESSTGGRVIDGSHETCGYLVTRCILRGIRFSGKGNAGALQTDYVAHLSAIDLLHVDACGILYCNYGFYFNHGGAGAAMMTESFIVNYGSNPAINGMGNCKFSNCIIEQCSIIVGGNNTDPATFTNCHIEHVGITCTGRVVFDESTGTTNSVTITLMPNCCSSYVTTREVGSYVIDHGHYNHIDAGFRFVECEGITSGVVNMAFPSTRDCGKFILQKNVPYLISLGISLDGATAIRPSAWVSEGAYVIGDQVVHFTQIFECIANHTGQTIFPRFDTTNWVLVGPETDYNFALLDYAAADANGVGYETYIDYGTIAAGRNTSRFTPIAYKQEWKCIIPETNVFLQPSHLCNLNITRPVNTSPMFRYADLTLDGHNWVIPGWYGYSGAVDNSANISIEDHDGKVRIKTHSAGGGPYISLSYGELLKLEKGKTYVAVMRGTKNGGTKLPQLAVGVNIANPGVEYQSQEPIDIGNGVYEAVCMFRAKDNNPMIVSFGHLTDPGDMDFTFDFVAVAELGNSTKYKSDGLPEVGVFYNGEIIIDEKPTTNSASMYICKTETAGNYGAKDVGCALNSGAWVSGGSYSKGDCVSYSNVVYKARTTHNSVATLPNADTTNWSPMERVDAEGQYVPDGNSRFTMV